MDHPNAEIARAAWEAVAHGDAQGLAKAFSPNVVWHASGRGPRSGTFTGLDAVLEYLAEIGDAAQRFDMRLDDVLVSESKAVVLFSVEGQRPGRRLVTDFIVLFQIEAGLVVEAWAVPRDQHAVDEFWAP